jgi:hypothetical protein
MERKKRIYTQKIYGEISGLGNQTGRDFDDLLERGYTPYTVSSNEW